MTGRLPVCADCVTEMVCHKNSVEVQTSEHTAREGDEYRCPDCRRGVIVGFGNPYRIEAHSKDEDCNGYLDDAETCRVCGVWHGDPCARCGGRGYHDEECPALKPDGADSGDMDGDHQTALESVYGPEDDGVEHV